MVPSQSLVLYKGPITTSSTSVASSSTYSRADLIPTRLFTVQTGTAIATELLYRLLIDLLNRFLTSFQRVASERLDQFSSYLERRAVERRDAQLAGPKLEASGSSSDGLKIVQEVGKLAEQRGFVPACPVGDAGPQWLKRRGGPPAPPAWVRSVLEGIDEGRLQSRDFWAHGLGD
ncbi:hypothetical protein BDV95DRAFT_610397 [Massariosphaeria phaeospora]|uniref:Uncharacterized protein n=1 Tax=Massariosphaeria phaeospora TaxID=100035 RepID=A0A7C8I132_9PLEO|nr:hypothetical protein BDV95DRAFT_610397 [Massariosphaeria phaeospora]